MKDVIVALDFDSKEKTIEFLKKFDNNLFVKVGMELFYKEGPSIIYEIKSMGHKIFLDLKLHDIPNTVSSATKSIMSLNCDMINYHIAGGKKMLSDSVKVAKEINKDVITLGITVLTSSTEDVMKNEALIDKSLTLKEAVLKYATLGKSAGLSGVVCSALEVPTIKESIGNDFICVTPGIRPLNNANEDQKRVVTPREARDLGSDYIVVGRPITRAEDPVKAYEDIRKEFLG